MFSFISDNFSPCRGFIETASKSASIEWELSSRKILNVNNLIEIPGLESEYFERIMTGDLSIHDIAPHEIYRKQREKIHQFFKTRHGNTQSQWIVTFGLNNTVINNNTFLSFLVYVFIDTKQNFGKFTLVNADGLGELNDKVLIISEILDNNKENVVFASTLNDISDIILLNKEYYILRLMAKGFASDAIAEFLFLSKHTIDDQRKILLDKFDAKNVFQLIYRAYKEGFV
jgi:DNA-binding CsgD family transcriptional regulator